MNDQDSEKIKDLTGKLIKSMQDEKQRDEV